MLFVFWSRFFGFCLKCSFIRRGRLSQVGEGKIMDSEKEEEEDDGGSFQKEEGDEMSGSREV